MEPSLLLMDWRPKPLVLTWFLNHNEMLVDPSQPQWNAGRSPISLNLGSLSVGDYELPTKIPNSNLTHSVSPKFTPQIPISSFDSHEFAAHDPKIHKSSNLNSKPRKPTNILGLETIGPKYVPPCAQSITMESPTIVAMVSLFEELHSLSSPNISSHSTTFENPSPKQGCLGTKKKECCHCVVKRQNLSLTQESS